MRALVEGLFDDAALFPPGNAPMAAAVPAHRELQARLPGLVGPFVVPAQRLDELLVALDGGPPVAVSLISPVGELTASVPRVLADEHVVLAAVEVPVAPDAGAAGEATRVLDDVAPAGVAASVEVPRTDARDEVIDVLAGTRYRAKLRTGGLRADLFPTPAELAATLQSCVARGVAVKCTAGLHSAVRRVDPVTGFPHHGFLNVLLATDALADGAPLPVVTALVAETDPDVVVAGVRTWSADRSARARSVFTSFGTCSVLEPVGDLVDLGLLPAVDRAPA